MNGGQVSDLVSLQWDNAQYSRYISYHSYDYDGEKNLTFWLLV